jgi:Zn-dependent protease with chaperone function
MLGRSAVLGIFISVLGAAKGDVSRFSTYLSAHPSAADRIEALQTRASRRGWLLTGPTTPLGWQDAGEHADD